MSNCTIDLKSFSGKSLEEIKQGLSQTQFSPDEMISAIRDYVTDPRKKQMISVWKLLSARNPKIKAFYDFFIQEDNKKFNISQNVINFLNPKSSTNDSTPAVNDSKAEVLDNPTKYSLIYIRVEIFQMKHLDSIVMLSINREKKLIDNLMEQKMIE